MLFNVFLIALQRNLRCFVDRFYWKIMYIRDIISLQKIKRIAGQEVESEDPVGKFDLISAILTCERMLHMNGLFGILDKSTVNKVVNIETDIITPNPHQPRRTFEPEALEQLSLSIKANGILQPLSVRRIEFGYELVAGERRLRAAKMAGLAVVPCIVMDISERNSAVMSLVENIQRKDLSFFDEAFAIEKLIDFYGMTQEDAAVKLGKSQSTIANKLRLLKLTEQEMKLITEYNLTERHARALLKVNAPNDRIEIIKKVGSMNFNVEQTERLIASLILRENEKASLKRRSGAFKNVKLFVNTINHAIDMMRAAGINADSRKTQDENCIEYVIRIPI